MIGHKGLVIFSLVNQAIQADEVVPSGAASLTANGIKRASKTAKGIILSKTCAYRSLFTVPALIQLTEIKEKAG